MNAQLHAVDLAAKNAGGRIPMRRLNRDEYANTVQHFAVASVVTQDGYYRVRIKGKVVPSLLRHGPAWRVSENDRRAI